MLSPLPDYNPDIHFQALPLSHPDLLSDQSDIVLLIWNKHLPDTAVCLRCFQHSDRPVIFFWLGNIMIISFELSSSIASLDVYCR